MTKQRMEELSLNCTMVNDPTSTPGKENYKKYHVFENGRLIDTRWYSSECWARRIANHWQGNYPGHKMTIERVEN